MSILRLSIASTEKREGLKMMKSPETQKIIKIVEQFISKNKFIVYGGTAINNILLLKDQFYDYRYEIPDYDFYAPNPMDAAIDLANMFASSGFTDVEAKSGTHIGTYKVFVNQMGVADLTILHKELFDTLSRSVIIKKGMRYAPVNFLRQSMYLELSRPLGDISRWEKVLTRLNLLNKAYPLGRKNCTLQRHLSHRKDETTLFNLLKDAFIKLNVIFIGGFANAIYSTYSKSPKLANIPDFDVLSLKPLEIVMKIKSILTSAGFNATITEYEAIGELVSKHYSISVDDDYVAFIYEPVACHSYNIVRIGQHYIKVGTIDTLLSYYLAFMYANRPYYEENRLLCLSSVLFSVQQENRLKQTGPLKRFSIQCYGNQSTLRSIREEKNRLHNELSHASVEFKKIFFKYNPNRLKSKTKKVTKDSKWRQSRKNRT